MTKSAMTEQTETGGELEISFHERLWAALSWIPATPLWPILAILAALKD
jgi:hypothetical protein